MCVLSIYQDVYVDFLAYTKFLVTYFSHQLQLWFQCVGHSLMDVDSGASLTVLSINIICSKVGSILIIVIIVEELEVQFLVTDSPKSPDGERAGEVSHGETP